MTLTAKQAAALNLLGQGEEYAAYFFEKAQGLQWFYPLLERGYFSPDRNPAPREGSEKGFYAIPHWPALEYLERISKQSVKPENRRYAEDLMRIVRSVTRPPKGPAVDNYRTWWYFAKILASVPLDVIEAEDIDLIGVWLESQFDTALVAGEIGKTLLPRLCRTDPVDCAKMTRLIDVATEVRRHPDGLPKTQDGKVVPRVQPYWLRQMFEAKGKDIGAKCGDTVLSILARRVSDVLPASDDRFSYVWRPAIEEHSQNIDREDFRHTLISLLRDVALGYVQTAPAPSTIATIRSFLRSPSVIMQRLGIYLISLADDAFRVLFFDAVTPETLSDSNYVHELYGLLEARFPRLEGADQRRVVDMIEALRIDGDQTGDRAASVRARWFDAIKGRGNEEADRRYARYVEELGAIPVHPNFASHIQAGFVSPKSPMSSERLLGMDTDALVRYLKDFQSPQGWDQPSEEGLAESLTAAIKAQPARFGPELPKFVDLPIVYKHAIISAFEDMAAEHRPLPWSNVLDFCLTSVRDPAFWLTQSDDG